MNVQEHILIAAVICLMKLISDALQHLFSSQLGTAQFCEQTFLLIFVSALLVLSLFMCLIYCSIISIAKICISIHYLRIQGKQPAFA